MGGLYNTLCVHNIDKEVVGKVEAQRLGYCGLEIPPLIQMYVQPYSHTASWTEHKLQVYLRSDLDEPLYCYTVGLPTVCKLALCGLT